MFKLLLLTSTDIRVSRQASLLTVVVAGSLVLAIDSLEACRAPITQHHRVVSIRLHLPVTSCWLSHGVLSLNPVSAVLQSCCVMCEGGAYNAALPAGHR